VSGHQSTDLFVLRPHDPGGRSKPRWPAGSVVSARFSDCGLCRYELFEQWDVNLPLAMFLMNPSVACMEFADPTLIRTGTFARSWNYGGQLIGNVQAYRVTDSTKLVEADDPVGPENDCSLAAMAKRAFIAVLRDLIEAKLKGEGLAPENVAAAGTSNVVDLMAALRRSVEQSESVRGASESFQAATAAVEQETGTPRRQKAASATTPTSSKKSARR